MSKRPTRRKRSKPLSAREEAISHIQNGTETDLVYSKYINDYKGKGVFAKTFIPSNAFIIEYKGRLICSKDKEAQYIEKLDQTYIYEFEYNNCKYWIDATLESYGLARLVNDSKSNPNCKIEKVVPLGSHTPHLCLISKEDIYPDEELLYYYGVKKQPWYEEGSKLSRKDKEKSNIQRNNVSNIKVITCSFPGKQKELENPEADYVIESSQAVQDTFLAHTHDPPSKTLQAPTTANLPMQDDFLANGIGSSQYASTLPIIGSHETPVEDLIECRVTNRPFSCLYCDKSFKTKPYYEYHVRCYHEEQTIDQVEIEVEKVLAELIQKIMSTELMKKEPDFVIEFTKVLQDISLANVCAPPANTHEDHILISAPSQDMPLANSPKQAVLPRQDWILTNSPLKDPCNSPMFSTPTSSSSLQGLPVPLDNSPLLVSNQANSHQDNSLANLHLQDASLADLPIQDPILTNSPMKDPCSSPMQISPLASSSFQDGLPLNSPINASIGSSVGSSHYLSTLPIVGSDESPVENLIECRKRRKNIKHNKLNFEEVMPDSQDSQSDYDKDDSGLELSQSLNALDEPETSSASDSLTDYEPSSDEQSSDKQSSENDSDCSMEIPITLKSKKCFKVKQVNKATTIDFDVSDDDNHSSFEQISSILARLDLPNDVQEDVNKENGEIVDEEKNSETLENSKSISKTSSEDGNKENCEIVNEEKNKDTQEKSKRGEYSPRKHLDGRKKHCCLYCSKWLYKMQRHITKVHSSEPKVKEILKLPKKEHKNHFAALRHKGDYSVNMKNLKDNNTFLTVVRESKTVDVGNYTPCIHCGGLYNRGTLIRHLDKCASKVKNKERGDAKSNANDVKAGKALLLEVLASDDKFKTVKVELFSRMVVDEVSNLIKEDEGLLLYAYALYEKGGKRAYNEISAKLRTFARLILEFRQLTSNKNVNAFDLIDPGNWDDIVTAMKALVNHEGDEKVGTPTLLLTVGRSLEAIACTKRAWGIKTKNELIKEDSRSFLELYKEYWHII